MRSAPWAWIGLAVLAWATASHASAASCGPAQAKIAQAAVSEARSWKRLHDLYAHARACDDASRSEDVTESVVRLLADKWATLPLLTAQTRADPGFAAFVVSHVDSTADTDDLKAVRTHAAGQCPPASRSLCERIKTAADRAARG